MEGNQTNQPTQPESQPQPDTQAQTQTAQEIEDLKHHNIMNQPLNTMIINNVNSYFRKYPAKLNHFLMHTKEMAVNLYPAEGTSGGLISDYVEELNNEFNTDETEENHTDDEEMVDRYLWDIKSTTNEGLRFEILKFIVSSMYNDDKNSVQITVLLLSFYLIERGLKDFVIFTPEMMNKNYYSIPRLYNFMTNPATTNTNFFTNGVNMSPRIEPTQDKLLVCDCPICMYTFNARLSPYHCKCSLKLCFSCSANLLNPKRPCPQCRRLDWEHINPPAEPRKITFKKGKEVAHDIIKFDYLGFNDVLVAFPYEVEDKNGKKRLRIKKIICNVKSEVQLRKDLWIKFIDDITYCDANFLKDRCGLKINEKVISLLLEGLESMPINNEYWQTKTEILKFLHLDEFNSSRGYENKINILEHLRHNLEDNSPYQFNEEITNCMDDEVYLLMEDYPNDNFFTSWYGGDVRYNKIFNDGIDAVGNFMNYCLYQQ